MNPVHPIDDSLKAPCDPIAKIRSGLFHGRREDPAESGLDFALDGVERGVLFVKSLLGRSLSLVSSTCYGLRSDLRQILGKPGHHLRHALIESVAIHQYCLGILVLHSQFPENALHHRIHSL
jgi:hypothetical protein